MRAPAQYHNRHGFMSDHEQLLRLLRPSMSVLRWCMHLTCLQGLCADVALEDAQ